METIKTETDIYADQEQTLTETVAVVLGKLANKMPMLTAREEFVEDVVRDWAELFGWDTAK